MGILKRQTLQAKSVEEIIEPKQGYAPIDFFDIDKAIASKLTSAEFRVWLYVMKFDRYGDEGKWRDVPSPAQMGVRLGMDRRTVEKAMERLRDLSILDMRVKSWQIINSTAKRANATGKTMKLAKEQGLTSLAALDKAGKLAQVGQDNPRWANLPIDGLNNSETVNSPEDIYKERARAKTIQTKKDSSDSLRLKSEREENLEQGDPEERAITLTPELPKPEPHPALVATFPNQPDPLHQPTNPDSDSNAVVSLYGGKWLKQVKLDAQEHAGLGACCTATVVSSSIYATDGIFFGETIGFSARRGGESDVDGRGSRGTKNLLELGQPLCNTEVFHHQKTTQEGYPSLSNFSARVAPSKANAKLSSTPATVEDELTGSLQFGQYLPWEIPGNRDKFDPEIEQAVFKVWRGYSNYKNLTDAELLIEVRLHVKKARNADPASLDIRSKLYTRWRAIQEAKKAEGTNGSLDLSLRSQKMPDFFSMSNEQHRKLIEAYLDDGEDTFIARETWHKEWFRFVSSYKKPLMNKVRKEFDECTDF